MLGDPRDLVGREARVDRVHHGATAGDAVVEQKSLPTRLRPSIHHPDAYFACRSFAFAIFRIPGMAKPSPD
jgi:hypothetical protein